ncbi:MAG: hypothetical protein IKC49_00940 [Clostridia bacterium]|nr:hypothetical protein [Clostridia bacterium]
MSKLKIKNWHIFILVALLSMFLFGCDNDVPVNSISFNLGEESQIVMLVDQELDMDQFVDIRPAYATNKDYKIISSDTSVLSVSGSVVTAHKEGECVLRLVARDNSDKEDIMTIRVKQSIEVLETPRNLQYDTTLQAFTFEMVDNASNYTININGEEYSVGNSNIFPISKYLGNSLDTVMTANVKAEASKFSFAYQSSPYASEPYKYYQTAPVTNMSVVGGVLRFDSNTSVTNIYINGTLYEEISTKELSLVDLNEDFAGQSVVVAAQAVVDQEIVDSLDNGVRNFNSTKVEKIVQVLDIIRPTMVSTTVSWNNVIYSNGYKVYIDNVNIANNKLITEDLDETSGVVNVNYFNLDNLANIETLITSDKISNIKVLPILSQYSQNIGMTNVVDDISVSRLDTPEFTLDEEVISWSSVDNASTYLLSVATDEGETKASIRANEFDLSKFGSGEVINITISANSSGEVGGVYYLYSSENDCTITKNADVEPFIEDYVLKFGAVSGEKYRIKFATVDGEIELEEDEDVDLKDYVFNPGPNEITICHLGNKSNTINSEIATYPFVQLEAINAINMANGTASVAKSTNNKDAIIELRTQIGGETKIVRDTKWQYNTTDELGELYLSAGHYITYVYVLGDGSHTFSYREKVGGVMTEIATAGRDFVVLASPRFDEVFDKTNNKVTFSNVDNASRYQIYTLIDGVYTTGPRDITENNEYLISLNAGESKNIKVQAIGDNIEYLTSIMSDDITVKKLLTPTLEYNNTTNIISIDNEDLDRSQYTIMHNAEDKALEEIELVTGENTISITAIAKDRSGKNYYINSGTNSITINKIDATSEIEIKNNTLIITPIQNVGYDIVVDFSFGESVSPEYEAGEYAIPLMNDDYSLVYDDMTTEFDVTIKYIAPEDDNTIATSDEFTYPDKFLLEQIAKPVLSRNDQTIVFANINENYTLANYKLIIDNGEKLSLNSFATLADDIITINAKKILDTAGDGVHDIVIEVNDPTKISNISEPISIERKPKVEVVYSKDNSQLDNFARITITAPTIADIYFREYPVEIGSYSITYTRTEMESGEFVIALDQLPLDAGNNQVKVKTITDNDSSYMAGTKTVHVFNSLDSDTLNINKLAVPTNLYVSNSVLHFTEVRGAIGYEIYDVDGSEYTKISDELVETNSYSLVNITVNGFIAVKAISDTNLSSNSSYSEQITIYPVSDPIVNVVRGHFVLTIDSDILALKDIEQASTILKLATKNDLYTIDLKNVDNTLAVLEGNILTIYADKILAYEYTDLTAEDIDISIEITYSGVIESGLYLLNTKIVEDVAYGLFAPTAVKKITDSENDYVDFLTWTKNEKNVWVVDQESGETTDIPENYIIKLVYIDSNGDEHVYLSSDNKLKYKQGAEYYSYGDISTTKVRFPYGYDENDNGSFEEGVDVIFEEGNYSVYIQAFTPNNIDGNKICVSKESDPCVFGIMDKPMIHAYDGIIRWDTCVGATSYNVEITQGANVYKVSVDTNQYDFESLDISGLCSVKVKAISTRNNVLNSAVSDELIVYRLPEVSSVALDDGMIKFTADQYFTSAKIVLTDNITYATQETIYNNEENAKNALVQLKKEIWSNESLSTPIVYVVEEEILKTIDGRSYTISIQLMGESICLGTVNYQEKDYNLTGLMMVNSNVANTFDITVDKLKPNTYSVSKGVVKYSKAQDIDRINYILGDDETNDFWKTTTIYRAVIKTPTETHTIYTLDYDDFVANKSSLVYTDYETHGTYNELVAGVEYNYNGSILYFNVYRNNIIDIANYNEMYYHVINRTISDGNIDYTGSDTLTRIDVSTGGTFFIDIGILGGDMYPTGEDQNGDPSVFKGYITSYNNDLHPFVKYGVNTLSTNSGLVQIKDIMEYDEDGNIIDYPVYKLTMLLGEDLDRIIYCYPYDDSKYTEDQAKAHLENYIQPKNDPSADVIYVFKKYSEIEGIVAIDLSEIKDGNEVYVFNSDNVYNVTIQTLAGMGNSNNEFADYLLNAKLPDGNSANTYHKYSATTVSVNSKGLLEFPMSYVTINSEKRYSKYYEITLIDGGDNHIIHIDQNTSGVDFDYVNHVVTYALPDEYDGVSYTIAVRAISYIEQTVEHEISAGKVSFNKTGTNLYRIDTNKGSLFIDTSVVSNNIIIDEYTISYTYSDDCVINGVYSVNSEANRLNANYSEEFTFGRMAKANNFGIYNGVLKWQAEEGATNFYIHITYLTDPEDLESLVEILFNTTATKQDEWYTYQFTDLADYPILGSRDTTKLRIESGYDYKISIMVVGNKNNNKINSGYNVPIDMKRLPTVTGITTRDGLLTWDVVENAVSYNIELRGNGNHTFISTENVYDLTGKIESGEYSVRIRAIGGGDINSINSGEIGGFTKLGQIEYESIEIDKNIIKWSAVDNATMYRVSFVYDEYAKDERFIDTANTQVTAFDDITGTFDIYIRAIGVGADKLFSGEEIEFRCETTVPVQINEIFYDDNKNEYYWSADNYLDRDVFNISYELRRYDSNCQLGEIENITETISYYKSDGNVFSYPITVMGVYSNFKVYVTRANTVWSPTTEYTNEDNGIIDLCLYQCGDGDQNPYVIMSASQLLNIKYFANRNMKFELGDNISLSNIENIDRVLIDNNGGLFSTSFNGEFNGNNYLFYDADIVINSVEKFSLFGELNNSKIENIKFGQENGIKVSNSFANKIENVVQLSLIATGANNSIIHNISGKVIFTVSGDFVAEKDVFIAGLIAEDNGSTISSDNNLLLSVAVNIESNIEFDTTSVGSYIAGLVAKGIGTDISNEKVEFTLSSSSACTSVAGLIAFAEGQNGNTSTIFNSEVTISVENVNIPYLGGVAGRAKNITIDNCTINGTISNTNIILGVYVGGVVGYAELTNITNNKMQIIFSLRTSVNTGDRYIGAIVGWAKNCIMTNNDSTSNEGATEYNGRDVLLGQYGRIITQ